MSKFEEIAALAAADRRKFNQFSEAAREKIAQICYKLEETWDIPDDRITYMAWNGLQGDDCKFTPPLPGTLSIPAGTATYDEANRRWVVGFQIRFSQNGALPQNLVFSALFLEGSSDGWNARFGSRGKSFPVHTDWQIAEFIDFFESEMRELYRSGQSSKESRSIGFQF